MRILRWASIGGAFAFVGCAGGAADRYFFVVDDGIHGTEPWISDGTVAGTRMIEDVHPGAEGSSTAVLTFSWPFARAGDEVYFAAEFPRPQIWKVDATSNGMVGVAEVPAPIRRLTSVGRALFFAVGSAPGWSLWTSDGRVDGTHHVADLARGFDSPTSSGQIFDVRGQAWFVASGPQNLLYRSDGTPQGTVEIGRSDRSLTVTGLGSRTLVAMSHDLLAVEGNELRPLQAFNPSRTLDTSSLTAFGDQVLFRVSYANNDSDLWVSDGTVRGTRLVRPFHDPIAGFDMRAVGGRVFFRVWSGGEDELWTSDGTPSGTSQVTSLPGRTQFTAATSHRLFFEAWDERHRELWVTDGTADGAVLLTSFEYPRASSGVPSVPMVTLEQVQVVDGRLFFLAVFPFYPRPPHWSQLWTSDGTEAGTQLLRTFP